MLETLPPQQSESGYRVYKIPMGAVRSSQTFPKPRLAQSPDSGAEEFKERSSRGGWGVNRHLHTDAVAADQNEQGTLNSINIATLWRS